MIYLKNKEQIQRMRKANLVVRDTLDYVETLVRAGVSTYELNVKVDEFIRKHHAVPSFLHYEGYQASVCISIDEEVVHGIPSKTRILQEGQIVSVDIGAILDGYQGDAARTFAVGEISKEKQQLIDVTKQSFFEGVRAIVPGARLGDVGNAISSYAESFGYGVVRELVGHGIGTEMHEDPQVPNYGKAGHGLRLQPGMTLAIEPMITMGKRFVLFQPDGWTVTTADGKPAAHYENTIAITEDGVQILSL